jgi:hypothetical protein
MKTDFRPELSLKSSVLGVLLGLQSLAAVGQARNPTTASSLPSAGREGNSSLPVQNVHSAAVAAAAANTPLLVLQGVTALTNAPSGLVLSTTDSNRDGKPDLILGGAAGGGILGELLGNGDGTFFAPGGSYGTGGQAVNQLVVADLNGDGIPDVVAAEDCDVSPGSCTSGAAAGVILGNGDGTFKPPAVYPLGQGYATAITVQDLNGDGIPDLVESMGGPSNGRGLVNILLGNGDGTFRSPLVFDAGGVGASSIVAGDIDGDGKPDVVVALNGGFSVLLGNGDGTLQPAVFSSSGLPYESQKLLLQDLNGDGRRDLLIFTPHGTSVLLGQGNGTFGTPTSYALGDYLSVLADVNRDGKLDIITEGWAINLGNGDGTFQPQLYDPLTGSPAVQFQVADINGDGIPDLAVIQTFTSTIQVMLGDGNGAFEPPVSYPSVFRDYSLMLADVNGDGKLDVVAVGLDSSGKGSMAVLLNKRAAKYEVSTTTLSPIASPGKVRQAITYTATVGNPSGSPVTGQITFREAGATIATVPLLNNQAIYSATYPTIGAHTITAAYSGDSANNFSSRTVTEYIRATSTMVLTTSGSPSFVGQPVTFAATIKSTYGALPDGDLVTFYDAQTILGSVPLVSGTATYTNSSLAAKGHVIKAVFPGDNSFIPSSRTLTQVVQKYATATKLTASPNPSTFGQTVSLTARVTSAGPKTPTGKVKFLDGTLAMGTVNLSNGVATFHKSTLAIGTHVITAQYSSDAASAVSTSPAVNQVVH